MNKKFNIKPPNWPKELTFQEFIKLNPHIINENQLITLYNQYLNKYLTELGEKKIHFKQSKINQLLTELKESQLHEVINANAPGGSYQFTNKYSIKFDRGAESYISTTFDPDDYNLNEGFTMSFWVNPSELGGSRFAMGREPATNQRFNFGIHSNTKIHVAVGSNRQRAAEHGKSIGSWFHYVVTFAGGVNGDRYIYINGSLISPSDGTATWNNTGGDADLWFGARNKTNAATPWTNGWSCNLTDIAIFNEAKDTTWISKVYNGGTPLNLINEEGLVGYWRFEEGEGTKVKDLSGEGNHGVFGRVSGDTTALPTWTTDVPE